MVKSRQRLPFVALLMMALLSACLGRVGPRPERLEYNFPATFTVERGTALFATNIIYESHTEEGIYLLIDGQRALKRKGDSVSWSGSPVPGVEVDLDLRVMSYDENLVRLVGKARVVVKDVVPQPGVGITTPPWRFRGPVAYGVARGTYIPGTTLTYKGEKEEGAELGGLYNEYPYRQIGDSILWEGQLRERVYLQLELRVVQFDERGLRVAGVATLWIGP